MKILALSTHPSPDSKTLFFEARASASFPSNVSASIALTYVRTVESPEPAEGEAPLPDFEEVVTVVKLLSIESISGKKLVASANVDGIYADLQEDYEFNSSISGFRISLEEVVIAEVETKIEIEKVDDYAVRPVISTLVPLWSHYPSFQFSPQVMTVISNASPDYSNSILFDVEVPDHFLFPSVFAPKTMPSGDFQKLIEEDSNSLISQTGSTYIVSYENEASKVAWVFANEHRTHVEYATLEDVYLVSINNLQSNLRQFRVINTRSPEIILKPEIPFTVDIESYVIDSVNFASGVKTIVDSYKDNTIMLDSRSIQKIDENQANFSLDSIGTSSLIKTA